MFPEARIASSNGTKPHRAKPKAKSAKKSATRRPALIPQANGRGALLAGGVPGNKGGTGRPPNWLKDWCEELLADETTKEQVRGILNDKAHPAFKAMWSEVASRAFGKPKESLELSGKLTLEDILAVSYARR